MAYRNNKTWHSEKVYDSVERWRRCNFSVHPSVQCPNAFVSFFNKTFWNDFPNWKIVTNLNGWFWLNFCSGCSCRGESAFHAMMQGFGWAKNPILRRMDKLDSEIPITLLYGSRSWVDNSAGEIIKQNRPNSYVNVQVCKIYCLIYFY